MNKIIANNEGNGDSRRNFVRKGLQTLIAIGAARATNALGQTLPSTYDEIMAALAK